MTTTEVIGAEASLEVLRSLTGEHCIPSEESVQALIDADLVLVSGQFVGAGKSTLIDDLGRLRYHNVASWTNRELRPGEVEGVDKCHRTLEVMAERAVSGFFLELEEMREGIFYATPSLPIDSKSYVKDIDLKGALRLRAMAPALPIIVPLPPLSQTERMVTEWERRVALRERHHQRITDKGAQDLGARLEGVLEEIGRIQTEDLLDDPYIQFVVNDDLPLALDTMYDFLETGTKVPQPNLYSQLEDMAILASEAVMED